MTEEEIKSAANKVQGLGGMTVNERLYVSGLWKEFEKSITKDRTQARLILECLEVDKQSIDKILENSIQQKSKPPYLLGLICLIPLVGAFVGLGLLLYGLLKYKDKWLSIIGAAGILWTILFYSTFFYAGTHASIFKKGFKDISQLQLNSLVKNIEFYKLEHGLYPDSLKELLNDDKLAPINDAVQGMSSKENSYYNYKKVGDKYFLFSSGLDGVPNTQDDLFPQVRIIDSTKIGLISHR
jgi:hypothetical protein